MEIHLFKSDFTIFFVLVSKLSYQLSCEKTSEYSLNSNHYCKL